MESGQQSTGGARLAPGVIQSEVATMRSIGAEAIVLAASMTIQLVMFGVTDAPGYGDPITDVFDWHAQNRLTVAIAVAAESLHMLLLLGFLAGLHGLVGRRGGAGADWSRLALAAGATLSAIYAIYSVSWIVTVLAVGDLTTPSPTFELAWQLHAAAFAFSLPALGVTALGAALAAHKSRLTPLWQSLLGIVGAGMSRAAGMASLEVADGSALLFVGLAGLVVWIVWLLVSGVRLVRGRIAERSGNAFT